MSLPPIDLSINLPTIIVILGLAGKGFTYINKMRHKIDTMWNQFLIEHPEYERREMFRDYKER